MMTKGVEQALAATRDIIARSRYCWAVTPGAEGGAHARGMERLRTIGDEEWTVWFLTDARSRKADEIRRSGCMTVCYDVEGDYVALIGRARLVEDRALLRDRWHESWNRFFEHGRDDPNAVFIKVEVDRIELCVVRAGDSWSATLAREAAQQWRSATG